MNPGDTSTYDRSSHIHAKIDGATFLKKLEKVLPALEDTDDRDNSDEDSRSVDIVVCKISFERTSKLPFMCSVAKAYGDEWQTSIDMYPVKIKVTDKDEFKGRAPYIHYVYCENDTAKVSWQETQFKIF